MTQGQMARKKSGTTVAVTFTVDEMFQWVCDKQGIANPDHLTDARWRSLRYIAEQTAVKLNTLFAGASVEERHSRSVLWSGLLFPGTRMEA